MRAVFFLLLFANLVFVAWAEWIDVPPAAPANDSYAKLPRLKLVDEMPRGQKTPPPGNARKTVLEPPAPASRCVSIGPFLDEPSAARGSSILQEKGFNPRPRAEQGEVSKGFWVYLSDLKTDREVTRALRSLQQSHVEDAHLTPDSGDVNRISVGIFSERDRAERRAQSLRKLGLEPQIAERKLPGKIFWMDVDIVPGGTEPTAEALVGTGASANLQTTPCSSGLPPGEAAPPPMAPGTTTTFRAKVASEVP